jgi:acyl-CoA reductase-like NAD-dependent aldehyde dehydrogenase
LRIPHAPLFILWSATTMGCLISEAQFNKVMNYIDVAGNEGARLVAGGKRPGDPALAKGWFVEATVFADVTPQMRIAYRLFRYTFTLSWSTT